MRWDYGSVYQEIRRSKNLTQEEVCGGVINRTTLVKFEQNKSIPRYETMRFLLQQLNMCFDEFDYICHNYQKGGKESLIRRIDLLATNTPSFILHDFIREGEAELTKMPNIPLERRIEMLKLVLAVREEGMDSLSETTKLLTETIWSRLASYDTWYKGDFRILSNILYHFPAQELPQLADLILERMAKYEQFKEMQGTRLEILSHLTYLFLEYANAEQCQRFGRLLIAEARMKKRYDYLAKGYIYSGLCQHDESVVERGLRILEMAEDQDLWQEMKAYVEAYPSKT